MGAEHTSGPGGVGAELTFRLLDFGFFGLFEVRGGSRYGNSISRKWYLLDYWENGWVWWVFGREIFRVGFDCSFV